MALSNLYFLQNYNTYYNREIKHEKTINDYINAASATTSIIGYNFNIADQVETSIIVNVDEVTANYLIVEDQAAPNTIHSRWFILDAIWKREGQWQVTLRRDLIADFLKPFLRSTVYVEKGWVTQNITSLDKMNLLIFNQESFTANQIKKKEILLKDKAGIKWVVGYLNKDAIQAPEGQTYKEIKTWTNEAATPDITATSIAASPIGDFVDSSTLAPTPRRYVRSATAIMDIKYYTQSSAPEYWHHRVGENTYSKSQISSTQYQGFIQCKYAPSLPVSLSDTSYGAEAGNYDAILSGIKIKYDDDFAVYQSTWENAYNTRGKILYVSSTNKYYRINVSTKSGTTTTFAVDPNVDSSIYTRLERYVTTGAQPCDKPTVSGLNFQLEANWSDELVVKLEEIKNAGYKVQINPQKMNQTINEAFNAFAIPVVEETLYIEARNADGSNNYNIGVNDYNSAFAIGQALMRISAEALDLQLLPYCPLPESWIIPAIEDPTKIRIRPPDGTVDITNRPIYTTAGELVNAIYFLSTTEFSTIIPYTDDNDYSTLEEIKAINQCDTWRIYSGDYSSSFEFNMARNGGVSYFEVDCKYKPYQPYIHVAPNFGGLYGQDYNDTRGLVCSNTNFSLPRLTNAWETYERNNLNYMNAFNRQIENMDVQRKYQKTSEWAQLAGGALTGGSSGAAIGSLGGPVGAVIGGVVGGAASAGAGLADMWVTEQLYKENKKYTIDQFNMSLQNIQALPNTLAAVGAQNPNNKVFPVLCFYSCSDVEREAFKKKIKWNGMTIGVVSENIADYINPDAKTYFKGQLVYFPQGGDEGLHIDTHELSELATELAKGILINKGVTS